MFYRNRLPPIIGFSALVVFFAVFSRSAYAGEIKEAAATSSGTATTSEQSVWYRTAWQHAEDTWRHGGWELYVPVYTFHLPFAYTPTLLRSYNDYPAGAGIGRGHYNASGNWEGIYAMEFADSHGHPEYHAGYGWIPTWRPFTENSRIGVGLTGFIMARSDIRRYTPFPGVLPLGSIGYRIVDIQAAYVPGGKNDGNVMLFWAKWSFY